ncbi:MAG: hypothetical protein NZ585_10485 [Chloracidobacterium sp.]|nr:hypothetical protein [Chloracidobacterium sp.]MDW8217782.1 hypothetical protein [Acidobacteriota bacterium]
MRQETLDELGAALAALPEVTPPAHLRRRIVTALDLEAARWKHRRTWRSWCVGQPKLFGYGLGMVAATLLFSSLAVKVWGPWSRLTAASNDALVDVPHRLPHRFIGGLTMTATRPRLTSDKGFDSFPTGLAEQPDGVLVIAEISPTGEARCVDVVEPPSDPALVAAVGRALEQMRFCPARRADGRPVGARIAFYVEQIAVRG